MSKEIDEEGTVPIPEAITNGWASDISSSKTNAKASNSNFNRVSRSTPRREATRTVEETRRETGGPQRKHQQTAQQQQQQQQLHKRGQAFSYNSGNTSSSGSGQEETNAAKTVTATTTSSGSDERGTSNSSSERDRDSKPAAVTSVNNGESVHTDHHPPHNVRHHQVVAHLPAPRSSSSEGNTSGSGEERETILEPHKEPGIHKIKSAFKKQGKKKKQSAAISISHGGSATKDKLLIKRAHLKLPPTSSSASGPNPEPSAVSKSKGKKQEQANSGGDSSCSEEDRANGSSGSGAESGYAGSASSNDIHMREARRAGGESSSSPSVSSSEDNLPSRHHHHHKRSKTKSPPTGGDGAATTRPLLSRKETNFSVASSSEIADFSSGATESKVAKTMKALRDGDKDESSEESITSCSNADNISAGSSEDGAEDLPTSNGNRRRRNTYNTSARTSAARASSSRGTAVSSKSNGDRKRRAPGLLPSSLLVPPHHRHHSRHHPDVMGATAATGALKDDREKTKKPPIMTVGSDVMAHVLTFLDPPEILSVLTMPLSKDWINTFTRQSELWRVLCLVEPFKARVEEESDDESFAESDRMMIDSFPLSTVNVESELRMRFGGFRLLYTNFVRCMRYLARIKDDAINGRPPSIIDYGTGTDAAATSNHNISSNQNLQSFLARARGVVEQQHTQRRQQETNGVESLSESSGGEEETQNNDQGFPRRFAAAAAARAEPIGVSDDGSSTEAPNKKKAKRRREKEEKAISSASKRRKVRYGPSKITQRLLLPAAGGVTSHHELPWSCAIYSIVNWMVGFADVEGIQTMCLKVLPFLLEDEQQRMTAQRAGLTDVVLRDMVMFPDSQQLHTAAFHTIVLLARPLGGREGMLFHTSMVNSSGIFNNGVVASGGASADASTNGKNGIAVMLDSMRRFQGDDVLQAMSCWSLVNIALAPAQKDVLIKLGGVEVTTNAMIAHPYSAEVQFRALFALINLVIPTSNTAENAGNEPPPAEESASEREILDDQVDQIVELVVLAMKNFCSSESILNRACLVLHNLSLTAEYHGSLLWTPNCYQMLEWCLSNYRNDQVLQQSAAGTLHRLQMTLSSSENLRSRFNSALASQQQLSLEQAHREAVMLHDQQQRQENASQRQSN